MLSHLGSSLAQLGKRQEAIDLYNQSMAIVKEIGEEDSIIEHQSGILYGKIGIEYLFQGKTKLALEFQEKAITMVDNTVRLHIMRFSYCIKLL